MVSACQRVIPALTASTTKAANLFQSFFLMFEKFDLFLKAAPNRALEEFTWSQVHTLTKYFMDFYSGEPHIRVPLTGIINSWLGVLINAEQEMLNQPSDDRTTLEKRTVCMVECSNPLCTTGRFIAGILTS